MPKFGAYGDIVASVISEFMVTLVQWKYVHKQINLNVKFIDIYKYILASLVMGGAVCLVSNVLPLNFISNCISITIGIILYFGCLILFKDQFQLSLLNKVLKRDNKEV